MIEKNINNIIITPPPVDGGGSSSPEAAGGQHDEHLRANQEKIIKQFWQTYDEVIILSICSIFGIAFRLLGASWFRLGLNFVFSEDSALGTNLPLNILSCFLIGLLCSGREAMSIVHSKVLGGGIAGRGIVDVGRGVIDRSRGGLANIRRRRRRNNQATDAENGIAMTTIDSDDDDDNLQHSRSFGSPRSQSVSMDSSTGNQVINDDSYSIAGLLGLDEEFRIGMSHTSEDEVRLVQLNALSQRILMSPSLVLFPAKKDHIVFSEQHENNTSDSFDDQFEIGDVPNGENNEGHNHDKTSDQAPPSGESSRESGGIFVGSPHRQSQTNIEAEESTLSSSGTIIEGVNERLQSLSNNVTAIRHADFASGWKIGTSPEDMKHIILIGLRIGFCGAVSTFSSWNSAMVNLVKKGKWGEAIGGYAIGLQLGIISFRFGQHVAVYIFVWRCRREVKRAERRGYAFRLPRPSFTESSDGEDEMEANIPTSPRANSPRHIAQRFIPSVRSLATIFFFTMFVGLFLAVFLLPKHQQFAISLLFTPVGTFMRWRFTRWNKRLPGFPLGTFSVNLLSCALSGSLGSFLASAGPGSGESIVLASMIAGFAGALSTFALFIVGESQLFQLALSEHFPRSNQLYSFASNYIAEIVSLIDPIIFKFDGIVYAFATIAWGLIIGLTSSQAKNWADEV